MKAKTDAQLLNQAGSDPSAFRELYDRYAQSIYDYLRGRTREEQAALDLTAETFAEAWLSRRRFRDQLDGSAGPWLFAIARNKLLMSVRRASIETRARGRLEVELPPSQLPPSDPTEAWLDGLDDALSQLPEGQRAALRLRVEDELAYEQVAAALGTTPQAARVRVHRALSTLRQRLTPNSIERMR